MEKLTHSAHAVGGANWHLQFTPKYRASAFRDDALREACLATSSQAGPREREFTVACLAEFRAVAARLGVGLEACEFGLDPEEAGRILCDLEERDRIKSAPPPEDS